MQTRKRRPGHDEPVGLFCRRPVRGDQDVGAGTDEGTLGGAQVPEP